jgi:hypothetical protein
MTQRPLGHAGRPGQLLAGELDHARELDHAGVSPSAKMLTLRRTA